jgi:DNA polymerase elongation subunit (family B)
MVNGKQTFARFSNEEMYITKEELVKAHSQGYVIHLLEAIVVETTSNVYLKMITDAYAKRTQLKRYIKIVKYHAKKLEERGELTAELKSQLKSQEAKYNIAQETAKVLLNSLYGKLGWASRHDISNYMTSNTKFLLEQFALGNITKISKVNENYTAYSGVQVSSAKRTNFLLASYITARARLHLIDILEAFEKAGYEAIYSDTDSLYAHPRPDASRELFNKHITPLLNSSKLGGLKLEMSDNVGEPTAEMAAVACKLYALRGLATGQEKIVARGVLKWMTDDSKSVYEKRRSQEG